jgi:hypothetical protein
LRNLQRQRSALASGACTALNSDGASGPGPSIRIGPSIPSGWSRASWWLTFHGNRPQAIGVGSNPHRDWGRVDVSRLPKSSAGVEPFRIALHLPDGLWMREESVGGPPALPSEERKGEGLFIASATKQSERDVEQALEIASSLGSSNCSSRAGRAYGHFESISGTAHGETFSRAPERIFHMVRETVPRPAVCPGAALT